MPPHAGGCVAVVEGRVTEEYDSTNQTCEAMGRAPERKVPLGLCQAFCRMGEIPPSTWACQSGRSVP